MANSLCLLPTQKQQYLQSIYTTSLFNPSTLYSAAQIYPNQNICVIRVTQYAYTGMHIRTYAYTDMRVCLISTYELTYCFFFS